jgi:hypothetical protein
LGFLLAITRYKDVFTRSIPAVFLNANHFAEHRLIMLHHLQQHEIKRFNGDVSKQT